MFWSGLVLTTSSMEAAKAADPGSARASAMISGFTRRLRGWQVSEAFMIDLLLRNFCARNAEYVQPVRLVGNATRVQPAAANSRRLGKHSRQMGTNCLDVTGQIYINAAMRKS